jgi:hypothetical protein
MNNSDTEILFPLRVVPCHLDIRGDEWKSLVSEILSDDVVLLDQLAFVLTVVKIAGCASCNSDSFRAMRGCTQCSIQAVRRFRGSDQEMLQMFRQCREDVEAYVNKNGYEEINR